MKAMLAMGICGGIVALNVHFLAEHYKLPPVLSLVATVTGFLAGVYGGYEVSIALQGD